jgi:hypothetical protein
MWQCACRNTRSAPGLSQGSRRVVPRTPFRGVVIAVRAAWRPLPLSTSAAAPPAAGPARRGAWPAARPARRSDRACRAEVGRPRRRKWVNIGLVRCAGLTGAAAGWGGLSTYHFLPPRARPDGGPNPGVRPLLWRTQRRGWSIRTRL